MQNQGFGVAMGYNAHGVWTLAAEAPDWDLVSKESYTATLQVAGTTYTASGLAFGARGMTFNVAPEIFGQLKSGQQLTVSANQKRYAISLDGIEPAQQRARECVTQYAAAHAVAAGACTQSGRAGARTGRRRPSRRRRAGDGDPDPAGAARLRSRSGQRRGRAQDQHGDLGLPEEHRPVRRRPSVGGGARPAREGGGRARRPTGTAPATAAVRPDGPHEKKLASTGTGFFISPDTLVTNHHVVAGCGELKLRKNGGDTSGVRLLATSASDDLAVLRAPAPGKSFLKLRVGAPIKPAEPVLVFGYPLAQALSSAGNTTLGNVTALSGLRDNSRYIQISAAVQPGNSGGPAIDEAGRLMGVVVSKLNAMAIARATGDIPQNVNFAIKVSTLVNFLEAHNIRYEPAESGRGRAAGDPARRARRGEQHPGRMLQVIGQWRPSAW